MSESVRAQLERGLSVGLSAVAALIAVTCASQGTLSHGPIAPLVPSSAGAGGGTNAGSGGSAGSGAGAGGRDADARAAAKAPSANAGMSRFFRDLYGLSIGTRREWVRIFWLGG